LPRRRASAVSGGAIPLKRFLIKICLAVAGAHTYCASFWNDVAQAIVSGKRLAEIRKSHKDEIDV